MFLGRNSRRLGFGGGMEPGGGGRGEEFAAGRGTALVGETGDVWILGTIGGSDDE